MRHRKNTTKLGRHAESRLALLRSLARGLIISGKIETTLPKAKFLRPFIEKLITRAKSGTLHNRRLLISRVKDNVIVNKLIDDLGPKYKDRNGGYTRIQRTHVREGDVAQMAVISFVEEKDSEVIIESKEAIVKKPKKAISTTNSKSKNNSKVKKA